MAFENEVYPTVLVRLTANGWTMLLPTIERELHLFAIVFLQKIESLRAEADTAIRPGTDHSLAVVGRNLLQRISVRTPLFDEASLLLGPA